MPWSESLFLEIQPCQFLDLQWSSIQIQRINCEMSAALSRIDEYNRSRPT